MSTFTIVPPTQAHLTQVVALLPRLAEFELPVQREPKDLYAADKVLLQQWFDGVAPNVHVYAAVQDNNHVLGFAMISLREELLSHAPSAHLEAIAVSRDAEGHGVARALLDHAHEHARTLGATSMTLHVFATNERARAVYEKAGYDAELLRCIKWFDGGASDSE